MELLLNIVCLNRSIKITVIKQSFVDKNLPLKLKEGASITTTSAVRVEEVEECVTECDGRESVTSTNFLGSKKLRKVPMSFMDTPKDHSQLVSNHFC